MTSGSHNTESAEALVASRRALIRQLTDHPDDIAATVELQAVKAASARLVTTVDTSESDSLRRAGMSFFDRMFRRGSPERP